MEIHPPIAGAFRYRDFEETGASSAFALLQHDGYLQSEAVSSGDAILGTVLTVNVRNLEG